MTVIKSSPSINGHLREESVDSAALAAATLTAVLAVLLPKGPFDVSSIPIGLTLIFVILAYEGHRVRNFLKTLAFSASMSFSLVLIVGPLIELRLHHGDIGLFFTGGMEADGKVEPWMNAVAWLAFGSAIVFLDRWRQGQWSKQTPSGLMESTSTDSVREQEVGRRGSQP